MLKKVTVREIAEEADVSIATVSRALNAPDTVKLATRNKIQEAIARLEEQPSEKPIFHSKMILASFPDLYNPFNTEVIHGILDAAAKRGYDVVFSSDNNFNSVESCSFFHRYAHFSGTIMAHIGPNPQTLLQIAAKTPVVMCSEHVTDTVIPYVAIDDFAAACTAVKYLISTGRTKIGLINSPLDFNYAVHRERGYRHCLEAAGLPINENWILHLPDLDFDIAFCIVSEILNSENRPDAFFCVSDVFAAAVVKAAVLKGIAIPGELGVVGFDDVLLSSMVTPAITTIRQPIYQLGYQSCSLLMNQIEGVPLVNKRIILNTELIVRSSS